MDGKIQYVQETGVFHETVLQLCVSVLNHSFAIPSTGHSSPSWTCTATERIIYILNTGSNTDLLEENNFKLHEYSKCVWQSTHSTHCNGAADYLYWIYRIRLLHAQNESAWNLTYYLYVTVLTTLGMKRVQGFMKNSTSLKSKVVLPNYSAGQNLSTHDVHVNAHMKKQNHGFWWLKCTIRR